MYSSCLKAGSQPYIETGDDHCLAKQIFLGDWIFWQEVAKVVSNTLKRKTSLKKKTLTTSNYWPTTEEYLRRKNQWPTILRKVGEDWWARNNFWCFHWVKTAGLALTLARFGWGIEPPCSTKEGQLLGLAAPCRLNIAYNHNKMWKINLQNCMGRQIITKLNLPISIIWITRYMIIYDGLSTCPPVWLINRNSLHAASCLLF